MFFYRGTRSDRDRIRSTLVPLIKKEFDSNFFLESYSDVLPALKKAGKSKMIEIYFDNASAHMLDPCPTFSEERYLEAHSDVKRAIRRGEFLFGFHHWLTHGRYEGRKIFPSTRALQRISSLVEMESLGGSIFRQIPIARWECHFDKKWYSTWLRKTRQEDVPEEKALEFFLSKGLWRGDIPSPGFDEKFYLEYYEEVKIAKDNGIIPSGYAHFVLNGEFEGRIPFYDLKICLSAKLGHLAEPSAIGNELALGRKLHPLPQNVDAARQPCINVFVPSLDPDIMFGGYIAFLHFLCRVAENGSRLRFIITEDEQSNRNWFLNRIRKRWRDAFEHAEFFNAAKSDCPVIPSSPKDLCISYSAWTSHVASAFAKKLKIKKILFFIQEDERIFHDANSLHFLISEAYDLDHAAIFNSAALADSFRTSGLGVFRHPNKHSPFIVFEHAITNVRPDKKSMINKKGKKLFVYARPENHAGRNLFEICILVLRRCVQEGLIDDSWDIVGIGTMGFEGKIDLGSNIELDLRSRIDQGQYENMLRSFDIGLSLMWAPHPGVIHFELASAGVVCVTNSHGNRDKNYFKKFGFNIVCADPSIDALVEGVREAVRRSADYDGRIVGSNLNLPTDWDTVFSQEFVKGALSLVGGD